MLCALITGPAAEGTSGLDAGASVGIRYSSVVSRVQRGGVAVALGVASCVCDGGGIPAGGEDSTSTSAATSTEPDAASTSSTSRAGESSGGSSGSSGTTGWVYEMPEGCGDGVIEPGVACYKPVPLLDERISYAVALDVDGDGRDDVVTGQSSGDTDDPGIRRFVENRGAFELVLTRPGEFLGGERHTDFDLDGDGRRDLLATKNGDNDGAIRWWSTAGGELGSLQESSIGPAVTPSGYLMKAPLPMDVRGDGWPEFLVVPYDGVLTTSRRVELVGREGGMWVSLGDVTQLEAACGVLEVALRLDVDGDGDQDMIAYDSGMGCDPYPAEYDPAWYRYYVFLNDSEAGTVDVLGNFELGAIPRYAMWARDFDEDSRMDVLVDVQATVDRAGGLVLYGRGDGTFDAGEFLDVATEASWSLRAVGNLFGHEDHALLISASLWDDRAFLGVPSLDPAANPVAIAPSETVFASGDFNGDGLLDIVAEDPSNSDATQILLSYP